MTGNQVIVANDGETGAIYGFDRRTGDVRWRVDAGAGGVSLDLALAGPRVHAVTSTHGLMAIETRDGSIAWKIPLKPARFASPASDGKRIYVADAGGVIHAVNARDGSPAWKRKLQFPPSSSVVAAPPDIYVGVSSTGWDDPWEMSGRGKHLLYRLDASSGKVRGVLALPAKPLGRAAVTERAILLFAGEELLAADKRLKTIAWRIRAPTRDQRPHLQVRGDSAFAAIQPRQLIAVNLRDGTIEAELRGEGPITTFLVEDDLTILGANEKLWAYALSPAK